MEDERLREMFGKLGNYLKLFLEDEYMIYRALTDDDPVKDFDEWLGL